MSVPGEPNELPDRPSPTGAPGWLWKSSVGLGVELTGAGVPLLLRHLGIDPAVSPALFVITFTDVFGFLIFLADGGLLVGLLG